jgi:putative transposase
VLRRTNPRLHLDWVDPALFAALVLRLPPLLRVHRLVAPGTILRWHRRLVANKGTYPHRVGRPPVEHAVAALIARLARENPSWGYRRIRGKLLKLAHQVGASTIRRVLLRIPPARVRDTATTWRQFQRAQASTMLACDFRIDCTVTLNQIYAFFVLEVETRTVHLLGATTNPDGRWTTQQIRNLVMDLGDRLTQFRFLVRDWAGQFAALFDAVLADVGIQAVKIPPVARKRTVSPNGSSVPSKPNSPTACRSSASGICG